jgi:hypothetical protein
MAMRLKNKFTIFCITSLVFLGFWGCSKEPSPQESNMLGERIGEKIDINWTWKRTVDQSKNVVYGVIKNKTDQKFSQVELEFRTQDANGAIIQKFSFQIENIDPDARKPFTKDYPAQATREDSGFVTVKKVIPAP